MMDKAALAAEALAIAEELTKAASAVEQTPAQETTTASRAVSPELRTRFINLRLSFIQRGINDPVLSRFDSFTVNQASTSEIAGQLRSIAENLAR